MPFIGKSPQVGAFQLIDSITTSATDTYALTVSGSAYVPESARNLIVSLNGVTQAPETAYTVSGSNIVFASALTASDVIDYILVIGDAVDIGTPSDNTVGDAQLKAALDLSSKTLTFANDQISGDVINGGTISSFASTGIDDNATSTAITINASENVGIGTASPSNQFVVEGATGKGALEVATGLTGELQTLAYHRSDAAWLNHTTRAQNIIFKADSAGATERMRINSSGNVGIGTTSPSSTAGWDTLLEVSGTLNAGIKLTETDTANGDYSLGTTAGTLRIWDETASAWRMTLDSSGNVGIGTTSPAQKLDVNGTAVFGGATTRLTTYSDSTYSGIFNGSSLISDEAIYMGSDSIFFYGGGTERMRIDANGNLGIGSTTPSSQLAGTNGLVIEQTTPGFALAGGSRTFLQYVTGTTWRMYDKNVGVDRITLNSSGNVGLGTTSPAALLHLNSNSDTYFIVGTTNATADARIQFRNSAGTDAGGLWYATSGNNMLFRTNSAERMRIDSSGNVGIGVTPTAGYGRKLQVHSAAGGGSSIHITDSSTGTTASDGLELITFAGAAYVWNREASFLSLGTSATERMRIDSSGNLGLGTSAPSSYGGGFVVDDLGINILTASSGSPGTNKLSWWSDNNGISQNAYISVVNDGATTNTGEMVFYTKSAVGTLQENMRIKANSYITMGTTGTTINTSNFGTVFAGTSAPGYLASYRNVPGTGVAVLFGGNAGQVYIRGDGDLENTNNSYGAISDERLKSNIVDASSQIDDIMAVQVRSYTLNETGATHIGVVAQELEASGMSGLVKTDDEGMKAVKYSVLYMKAIKALQEAVTRIETLESEVAALKGA